MATNNTNTTANVTALDIAFAALEEARKVLATAKAVEYQEAIASWREKGSPASIEAVKAAEVALKAARAAFSAAQTGPGVFAERAYYLGLRF